jgi:hypothetical protein
MTASFVPLVVRAYLRTPISLTDPIPFEGILYAARFNTDPSLYGTPLDCIAYRDGIPQASAGILVGGGIAGIRATSTKVVRSIDFKTTDVYKIPHEGLPPSERVFKKMSPYRARIRDYPLLEGADSVAFQVLGDPDRIGKLLSLVPSIGTLRNRGYGEIDGEWHIGESDADPETCGWFSEGRLMRRLPASIVERTLGSVPDDASMEMGMLEPPFWDNGEQISIATPSLRSLTVSRRDLGTLLAAA